MPSFFTDRHDPTLAPYHDLVAQFREMNGRVLNLRVTPEVVRNGDTLMFQYLVLAAQHHPDVLDRLLFGIKFEFEQDSPLTPGDLADELTWKADPAVQRWLAGLSEHLPWAIYFVQDHDARFHTIFGDVLQQERDELEIRATPNGRGDAVGLTGSQAHRLFERVLQASLFLLHFCHPAGLVPQPAIEALLAEFDIPDHTDWTYDRLYDRFQQELDNGFRMRAVHPDEPEQDG